MNTVFCLGLKDHTTPAGHGTAGHTYDMPLTQLGMFATREAAEKELNTLNHPLMCGANGTIYPSCSMFVMELPIQA